MLSKIKDIDKRIDRILLVGNTVKDLYEFINIASSFRAVRFNKHLRLQISFPRVNGRTNEWMQV